MLTFLGECQNNSPAQFAKRISVLKKILKKILCFKRLFLGNQSFGAGRE